ncbi:MAG TPA: hypothetical protein VFQ90_17960 [Stellaceae bacterium]|jgi:hypothetical protein|nr:hypothetical protein [Stellaceae bacterium]
MKRLTIALTFATAVATPALAASSAVTCKGIIGSGYGTVTMLPDRGDGKIHGSAIYQWEAGARDGAQSERTDFTGETASDGSIILRRLDGTIYFKDVHVTPERFTGRWVSVNGNNTAPADFRCAPYTP